MEVGMSTVMEHALKFRNLIEFNIDGKISE
jgi:hypothetical protein